MFTKYYRLLGLEPNAGIQEIKRAYRKLAKSYHPDLNLPTSDREKFIEITKAYDRLIERLKRPRYTKYVHSKKSYKAKKKKTRTGHPADKASRHAKMPYSAYRKESDAFVDKENFWKYRLYLYCGMILIYGIYLVIAFSIISGFMVSSINNPLLWFLSLGLFLFWRRTHHLFLGWKKDFTNVFNDQ